MTEINADSEVIAIDIGGTNIKAARIDSRGNALAFASVATPVTRGKDAILGVVVNVARSLETANVSGVSLVVPGIVDSPNGVARYSANLGWRNWPLREILAETLNHRVTLGHDVMAAGETEMRTGQGMGNGLVVVIGTGVACVTVMDGQIVRGAEGMAGELGHVVVRPGGAVCGCGNRGCLEAYASAGALPLRFRDVAGRDTDVESIVRNVKNDSIAQEVWAQAIDCLASALAMVICVQDPAKIVLAGGLSLAGDALTVPLVKALKAQLVWRAPPSVELSRFRQHAGVVGAAIQFYQSMGVKDFSTWRPWPLEGEQ